MKVRILSPIGPVLDEEAEKISFESLSGSRTFLPNHIDTVSALPPNIVSVRTTAHKDIYLACTQGVLVKQGTQVLISVHKAVIGNDLNNFCKFVFDIVYKLHFSTLKFGAFSLEMMVSIKSF